MEASSFSDPTKNIDRIESLNGRVIELDWENHPRLQHWLKGRPENTVNTYKSAFRKYIRFTGMTPEEILNEKLEDIRDETKKPWEKEKAENRVKAFNKWLLEDYVIEVGRRKGQKGAAPRSALQLCTAVIDFFSRHKLPLTVKLGKDFKGATRGINETEKMTAEQIEKLAYHAPTKRDKAYIWIGFQSGLDVSTVLSLSWGHIEKEFDNPPMGAILLRDLERRKEKGRRFTSIIYKTAIKHLKSYLRERFGEAILDPEKRKSLNLEWDTPLFVGEGKWRHRRLAPRWIQGMLRDIAPETGLAGTKLAKADINPLRPHSLRASFSDQMAKAGASKELVDFLMGHKLKFDTAYFGGEEGLREAYVKYAEVVLEPKRVKPVEEIESVMREEIDKLELRIEEQSSLIRSLERDKTRLESQMNTIIQRYNTMLNKMEDAEIANRRADLFFQELKEVKHLYNELLDKFKQSKAKAGDKT